MSEYQYYEFITIDRPLTSAEMAELRTRSTRASITPTSFINEYHWGDLKGDPKEWMKRYFDAHVYVANWCQCVLYLRVPLDTFTAEVLTAFETELALRIDRSATHWVMAWSLNESENYERFGMEDGRGWMGRLMPLRDELLRGDLRPLYLGWLAGVTAGEVDEDRTEPPPPPGLSRLTAAQLALAEFLEIDQDLLAAAGTTDASAPERAEDTDARIDVWLAGLTLDEARATLGQLLRGQSQQAERQLKTRFLAWQREQLPDSGPTTERRTVAELQAQAETARQARRKLEAEQQAKREAERQAKRQVYLRSLAADFPGRWRAADQKAQRGIASAYDEVLRDLVDLSDAYQLCVSQQAFERALQSFMESHSRRSALVRRLVQAGLWKK